MPVTINSFSRPDYTVTYAGVAAMNTELPISIPAYNKESGDCWVIAAISGSCGYAGQRIGGFGNGSPIPFIPQYGRQGYEYLNIDFDVRGLPGAGFASAYAGGWYDIGYDFTMYPQSPFELSNYNLRTGVVYEGTQDQIINNGKGFYFPKPIGIIDVPPFQEPGSVFTFSNQSSPGAFGDYYYADTYMTHMGWKNPLPNTPLYFAWTNNPAISYGFYNETFSVHGVWVITGVQKTYFPDLLDYRIEHGGMTPYYSPDYSVTLPFYVQYDTQFIMLNENRTVTQTVNHGPGFTGGQILAHTIALGPITPNPTATGETNYQVIESSQTVQTTIYDPNSLGWSPKMNSSWSTKAITGNSTTINRTRSSWGPFSGMQADEPGVDCTSMIIGSIAVKPHNGGLFSGQYMKNEYDTTARADRKIFPVQSRRPYMYTKKITDLTKSRQIPDHWA